MRKLGLLLFFLAAPLLAHDFWIEPTSFRPEPGSTVGLALVVGEHFRGDPVPRRPEKIEKFVVSAASGERPVEGVPGRDPAGSFRVLEPGYHVVGYRSRTSQIELEAEKFELYLTEEGLRSVISTRAAQGSSAAPGREIYSRCAKSLVDAGGAGAAGYDRVLGLRLELIPQRSPKDRAGGPMTVLLLFDGKPLAGALVVAMNRESPGKRLSAVTGADGRVALDLARGRVWLVKAVHMVAAPSGSGADWESLWASLTFEVP